MSRSLHSTAHKMTRDTAVISECNRPQSDPNPATALLQVNRNQTTTKSQGNQKTFILCGTIVHQDLVWKLGLSFLFELYANVCMVKF